MQLTDVVIGRAMTTIPADGEQPSDTIRRASYDECNFQFYSLIYRSFTPDSSGNVGASDGRALWRHLASFNYEITDIPHLKRLFYDPIAFRQKPKMRRDIWATEVRLASNILITNGHFISEREKTLVFCQGLIREDLQSAYILPSRT